MPPADETCWTLIRDAAEGNPVARETFGQTYLPAIRAYLAARWQGSRFAGDVDDAVQEVFLDFLKPSGALGRADPAREGGFRAFLYGVTRIAALRIESRRSRHGPAGTVAADALEEIPSDETGPSGAFDRAWAQGVLRAAGRRQEDTARAVGDEAVRRVELLRLRFQEGLPIRGIAERWGVDPAYLHHQYAQARSEFEAALVAVVGEHHSGTPGEVRRECARLLSLLG